MLVFWEILRTNQMNDPVRQFNMGIEKQQPLEFISSLEYIFADFGWHIWVKYFQKRPKGYLGPYQTSMMESFTRIISCYSR